MAKNWRNSGFVAKCLIKFALFDEQKMGFLAANPLQLTYVLSRVYWKCGKGKSKCTYSWNMFTLSNHDHLTSPVSSSPLLSSITLASPAMGRWGTCPPRLSASYFKRTNTENVQKQRDFCAIFLLIFGPFFSFFARSFPQGVIIVPKMPEQSPINFNSTRTSDSGKKGS